MTQPEFINLCERIIRRVAAQYWFEPQERDDFVQDAWLGILTALAQQRFDPDQGQFASWLFIVVRNRAIRLLRRRWRAAEAVEEYPLELLPCRSSDDPSQRLDRSVRIEAVRSALELLAQRISPLSYAVFQLRQLQQASIAEVAARLGLTPEQVRVYDHRARRKLEKILARAGE